MMRLNRTLYVSVTLCCAIAACSMRDASTVPSDAPSDSKTIGLVLSGFDFLFYSAKNGKEECPHGLVYSSKENWDAQYPTRNARQAQYDRCGGVDNRGPECENVLIAPELVRDPLPYRQVEGTKSYGGNLDGNEDGRETAHTCAHDNFVHPDGSKGIDNQYYRLLGCQKIVQPGGLYAPDTRNQSSRESLIITRARRLLLEIREFDDGQNDEHVSVALYRGKDTLAVDAQGNATPWQTQRIDEDTAPQYVRGRIVRGELITEPADMSFNFLSFISERPVLVRGMQFRLRLTDNGAEGLSAGYVDVKSWWRVRRTARLTGSFAGDSPPALYEALHRLADGYKDAGTGACTALSSATKVEFVRAYIGHPRKDS